MHAMKIAASINAAALLTQPRVPVWYWWRGGTKEGVCAMPGIRYLMGLVIIAILVTLTGAKTQARDGKLPPPTGEPILTVEGNIQVTNGDGKARFDRAMLEEFGMSSVETTTPWFDRSMVFEGILVDRIMKRVGANGTEVVAIALNDYRTTIPLKDFEDFAVILALKRNNEYMTVKDKGPLFIIYPYDSDPELKSQKYYARSVWQLSRLIVQ
jgi:hypothetical protein